METSTNEKKETLEEISEVLPYGYEITSYGIDFDVNGLVERMRKKDIRIPYYQRAYVWKLGQASRFIESLLLGLPVPGIFLSKEPGTEELLVIDGQQRLKTLLYFYDGKFLPEEQNVTFALESVQDEFMGATYATLPPESKRRLNNAVIHATIIKQDKPSEKSSSSVYYIFERLNTGGTQLVPQEIRSAIFHGEFRDLLNKLNCNREWRAIYGNKSRRIRDEELILRFFAFHHDGDKYSKPMKKFLNDYMRSNRHLQKQSAKELTQLFEKTVSTAYEIYGKESFKYTRGILASLFDSIMVGISKRLEKGPIADIKKARDKYINLLADTNYMDAVLKSTSDEKNVETRLTEAVRAFADVK